MNARPHRRTRRGLLSVTAAGALLLGACGGDDSSSNDSASSGADTTVAATDTTSAAPATTAAPATSAAPTTSAAPSTASTTAGATTAGAAVDVELVEWSVTAPATLKAGPQTFNVTNGGEFPHEFVIMKGTYETLPQSPIGAVLEDQLPAGTLIGRTSERIESKATVAFSADLPAGQYVLLCNIASGPNSHAGKGQRLNITVS